MGASMPTPSSSATLPACPRCGATRLVVDEVHSGIYRAWGASIRLHLPRRVARCTGPGCGFRAEGPHITAADIRLPGSMGGGQDDPPGRD